MSPELSVCEPLSAIQKSAMPSPLVSPWMKVLPAICS
jgi:hypothetical protein